jgi:uncharacterized LabA/DUF88 family protein
MNDNLNIKINQTVAILVDGNNIEMSLQALVKDKNALVNFDTLVPKLLNNRGLSRLIYFREGRDISTKLGKTSNNRGLSRLIYFREGRDISTKLGERLLKNFHGSVVPCYKSADIPLTIKATQIAPKVDTIIILSGDSDYVELVRHLKGEGVRVEIAAVKKNTANILMEEADLFTAINEEDCFILKHYSSKK